MAELKTKPTEVSVDAFIAAVPHPERREDAGTLRAMMERLSGEPATMWGPTMIGFGHYHYRYDSGHEGDMPRIAFSPRAAELVLYLDVSWDHPLMARLGKYRTSKACLYIKRLAQVDMAVLEALAAESLVSMRAKYPDGA